DKLADKGHALPDGSFPIANKGDLKNAIQAIGRAKDPGKAKAHIKARARALGAADMIPDTWGKRAPAALLTEDEGMALIRKHLKPDAGLTLMGKAGNALAALDRTICSIASADTIDDAALAK